ncbi:MAG: hydroxyethylthiazole kinase [Alphaproteobacteria bacterium]
MKADFYQKPEFLNDHPIDFISYKGDDAAVIAPIFDALRQDHALHYHLHALVNQVATPLVASFIGAMGIGLSMSDEASELDDFVDRATMIYLNLGTPNQQRSEALLRAAKRARSKNIPIMVDPVMIDISSARLEFALKLGEYAPIIWRMNQREAACFFNHSAPRPDDCYIVTGRTNYIFGAKQGVILGSGHHFMPYVTGLGCCLSAVIACFMGVAHQIGIPTITAARAGVNWYNGLGLQDNLSVKGPATLPHAMIDLAHHQIYNDKDMK